MTSSTESSADDVGHVTAALVARPPVVEKTKELRVMFTGLDGTITKLRDKVKQREGEMRKVLGADGLTVYRSSGSRTLCREDDDVESVTHLVAPKNQLKRTVKLLCGVSCCDHIVDERWLDESARAGAAASEIVHCLKDTAAEAKWGFSLYHTMYEVPKAKRRELLAGLQFFITNHKSVLPPVKELVRIVECAGGSAETKGRCDSRAHCDHDGRRAGAGNCAQSVGARRSAAHVHTRARTQRHLAPASRL
ncbi:hypothetical protein PINS_up020311 [Pythium insidiosum]|nr:hypothetical protein PINS_up020311 [Pythium insidiosum]